MKLRYNTIFSIGFVLLILTGCSLSEANPNLLQVNYTEPVLILSPNYSTGLYVYNEGAEYYLHENELVKNEPAWKTFSTVIKVNDADKIISFQWYKYADKIRILKNEHLDEFYFETIDGCSSHALLVIEDPFSGYKKYKLCDLNNNIIIPLFENQLDDYAIDSIQLSADISHAIISTNKGEEIFIFDGEKLSSICDLVGGSEKNSYGARFVENQIVIIETTPLGTTKQKSAYLYDFNGKTVKKTIDCVMIENLDNLFQKGRYIYYSKEGLLNIADLVSGTTVETNIFCKDLYYIPIILDEEIIFATHNGKILQVDSKSGEIITELQTKLEDMKYSATEENYSFEQIASDEGVYVAIYKSGEKISIYKLEN